MRLANKKPGRVVARGMYLDTIFNILLFICPAAHQWWGVAIDQCYQWTPILQ